MRKIFWMLLLLGGYYWVFAENKEGLVIEKCRVAYQCIAKWLEDAEFHWNLPKQNKIPPHKKPRRWD